jgi:glycerophosphoryl diester phosphodiesterase
MEMMEKLYRRIAFTGVILFCSILAFALPPGNPQVYLSNYSFPASRMKSAVCRILGDRPDGCTLNLSGANADLFRLKDNEVFLSARGRKYFKKFGRADLAVALLFANKKILERTFTLLKDDFAANGVVAHRGAWKNTGLPQNSIASLQAAIKLGCAGSEFDIRQTADSVLVINHDPVYEGMGIEHARYTDLLGHPLSNGEPLPTFKDYLKAGITRQRTRLFAEIKPSVIDKSHVLELARRVVEEVWRQQAQAWVIYISFDYDALMEVRRLDPSSVTMYLNGDKSPEELLKDGIQGLDYHYNVYHKEEQWIKKAHAAGLKINVWTVDTVPEMEYFLERKAEFITTNEPENLFALLPKPG